MAGCGEVKASRRRSRGAFAALWFADISPLEPGGVGPRNMLPGCPRTPCLGAAFSSKDVSVRSVDAFFVRFVTSDRLTPALQAKSVRLPPLSRAIARFLGRRPAGTGHFTAESFGIRRGATSSASGISIAPPLERGEVCICSSRSVRGAHRVVAAHRARARTASRAGGRTSFTWSGGGGFAARRELSRDELSTIRALTVALGYTPILPPPVPGQGALPPRRDDRQHPQLGRCQAGALGQFAA